MKVPLTGMYLTTMTSYDDVSYDDVSYEDASYCGVLYDDDCRPFGREQVCQIVASNSKRRTSRLFGAAPACGRNWKTHTYCDLDAFWLSYGYIMAIVFLRL